MNKIILIFALLLASAINVEPDCKAYEAFDEETNKCVKVCKEKQFAYQEDRFMRRSLPKRRLF